MKLCDSKIGERQFKPSNSLVSAPGLKCAFYVDVICFYKHVMETDVFLQCLNDFKESLVLVDSPPALHRGLARETKTFLMFCGY